MNDATKHLSLKTYLRQEFLPKYTTINTEHHHKAAVTWLIRFLGRDVTVGEIDDDLIERYAEWLKTQSLMPSSRRLYRASLRTIVGRAAPDYCMKVINDKALSSSGSIMEFFQQVYLPVRLLGKPLTVEQHIIVIRRLCRHLCRAAMLTDLNDELIAAHLQWALQQGLARPTVNDARSYLLTLWRFAYKRKLVREWPLVDKLREYRRLPKAWTTTELERLLSAAAATPGMIERVPAGGWWTALLLVMYDTGVRRRAAFSIEREHVDLDTGWLIVPAENQKQAVEQRFKLSDQTVDAIRRIWLPPRRLLFPWAFRKEQLYRHLKVILGRAGLPCGRADMFHKLRKTCASYIAKAAGLDAASRQLGHSGVEVSKRYVDPQIAQSQIDGVVYLPRLNFAGGNGK